MADRRKQPPRFDPLHHFVNLPLGLALLIACSVHAARQPWGTDAAWTAWLLAGLALVLLLGLLRMRVYATKSQDRIIRAEERLRHFRLTGRELDPRLTLPQLLALRNAGDGEFPALCGRAAAERLEPPAIRAEIREFRPDEMRI
ncbi:ABC transporter permease [Paenibacillus albicereus]|uniref:ABC transporter permease n=1 Tax=Paenibacillus albicereus TaxID=2726185 RepID=A0A6H2H2U0_9BACL|nr:DUF6526 family protein [Paenibacillus albicereus]QJC53991.1 ABC transporter permease [Paenibacillus albicereus]